MATSAFCNGRSSWHGADLIEDPSSWHWRLSAEEISALKRATFSSRAFDAETPYFGSTKFVVPELESLLCWIAKQLEDGTGFVRISGLHVQDFTASDLSRLFWGVCVNIGVPVYQTKAGEVLSEIKDETGAGVALSYETPGPVKSSRNISRSTAALRFHTDRCDVLGLFCTSNALSGGISKIVSSIALRDEIAARRPDLLGVLYEPFWHLHALTDNDDDKDAVFAVPVFGEGPDGSFASQLSRNSINQAQDIPSVPRLSDAQLEALDLLAELADKICLQAAFEEGDMQFMNQHITYHGRTSYTDDHAINANRILLRVWLSTRFSRALPTGYAVQWGDIRAGALRGGALPGRCAV